MRRLVRWSAALVLASSLSACQLRIALDVAIDRDAGGELELAVAVDAELEQLLREAGVDLLRGFDELAATEDAWEATSVVPEGGGLEVRFSATFDDPAGFTELTRALHASLTAEDGRLFDELAIALRQDGGVQLDGRVGLVPPTTPGATGIAFDEDDLARFIAEQGADLVDYEVTVALPASPRTHDADEVAGVTLTWDAPIGSTRVISAVSNPPPALSLFVLAAVAFAGAAVASIVVVVSRRRV